MKTFKGIAEEVILEEGDLGDVVGVVLRSKTKPSSQKIKEARAEYAHLGDSLKILKLKKHKPDLWLIASYESFYN